MKKEVNYSKYSQEELIKLLLEKDKEFDRLEAKFYELQKKYDALLKEKLILEEKNKLSVRRLFGKKSESKSKEVNVINEAEKTAQKKDTKSVGRKKGSTNFSKEYLENNYEETITLEPDEYEQLKDNKDVFFIDEDISYKAFYEPGRYKIVRYVRKKYLDKKTGKFYQKDTSNDPFPHSICTSSLATNIMVNKFMYGLPYYRQAEVMLNNGIGFSRQDLCNYQIKSTDRLKPLYNFLKEKLINTSSKVINADETTLKVIETKKDKCYVWVYCTTFYDNPIYLYEYCKSRSKENVVSFLSDYKGYLLTDCYSGYSNLENIENAYCWAHARRNFYEIVETLSDELIKESFANKMVHLIDKLFVVEAKFKELKYGPNKIKEERNKERYLSLVENVFTSLKSVQPEKGTKLERSINYMLERENEFKTFLKDGHIEISNNISERAIKPFVIDRKNFLFSNTENGARSSMIFFSLLQTARANMVDPIKYISNAIDTIGDEPNENLLESLLPWNYAKNHPEVKL